MTAFKNVLVIFARKLLKTNAAAFVRRTVTYECRRYKDIFSEKNLEKVSHRTKVLEY